MNSPTGMLPSRTDIRNGGRSNAEPAKDETFIFSRFRIYQYIVVSVRHPN